MHSMKKVSFIIVLFAAKTACASHSGLSTEELQNKEELVQLSRNLSIDPAPAELPTIICPFLRIVQPDTSSFSAFVQDIEEAGASPALARSDTLLITTAQEGKGLKQALQGAVPDLERLTELNFGLSSEGDFYQLFPDEVSSQLRDKSVDGMISLQDLVDVKKWVAEQIGVVADTTSQVNTYLSFQFVGGDFDTGLLELNDFLTFIEGEMPDNTAEISIAGLIRARQLAPF